MEVFLQAQGAAELWPSVLLFSARVVPHRLCRPTAPPSAWSVPTTLVVSLGQAVYALSAVHLLSVLVRAVSH